jgi:hypothetical protein
MRDHIGGPEKDQGQIPILASQQGQKARLVLLRDLVDIADEIVAQEVTATIDPIAVRHFVEKALHFGR